MEPFNMFKENSDMEQSVICTEKVADRDLIPLLTVLKARVMEVFYLNSVSSDQEQC
jgi:hypothetical protein